MRHAIILFVAAALLSACGNVDKQRAARAANPAPCPNAFVLEDAARFITFAGEEQTLSAVTHSGEFDDVRTRCRYFADVPIEAEVDLVMSVGRVDASEAETMDIKYFVAVTRTDRDVIAKQEFSTPVTFRAGERVATIAPEINRIVIPRRGEETSGVNFELAVGFVLERRQLIYNRSGKSLKFPEES